MHMRPRWGLTASSLCAICDIIALNKKTVQVGWAARFSILTEVSQAQLPKGLKGLKGSERGEKGPMLCAIEG